jgi:hypothetical protein
MSIIMPSIETDPEKLLRMPSSRGPVLRTVLLIAVVFLLGAGVGALAIALTHHSAPKRGVVEHVVRAARNQSPARPSLPAASVGVPHGLTDSSQPAPQSVSVVPAGARLSFAALAATLGGAAGLAVAPLGKGPVQRLGALQDGHAWSTMKVPVLTTLLGDDEQSGQALSPQEQTDATLALEQSDNAAAEELFAQLEQIHGGLVPASEAVQQTLVAAGDLHTSINTAPNTGGFTTWGQSLWSPSGEVRFYRALARQCLLDPRDTEYVLGLMRSVIPAQRWGAGAANYPSSLPLGFKGGWGPDEAGDYLVRQTAIVGSGDTGYVLSVIALPSGGAFSEGVSMITAIASWARRHLRIGPAPPASCPSPP